MMRALLFSLAAAVALVGYAALPSDASASWAIPCLAFWVALHILDATEGRDH